jgi:DNA-binding CsgD family transcriptional regulator
LTRVRVTSRSPVYRAGLEAVLRASGVDVVHSELDADVIVAESEHHASEGPPVILLTDEPTATLRAGVQGLLPREATESEISGAVAAVAAGLVAVHPQFLDAVAMRSAPVDLEEPLTPREVEVLRLLAEGVANKEIAFRLGISEHTVKFHVASLLDKLHAATRTEAVSIGLRGGLITL